MASLCKLLELLAPIGRPLSAIAGELPESAVVHRQVRCPWARKGAVMRILTERTKGKEVDITDGIKVYDERGWAQVLPDPDEPLVHIFAEGKTPEDSASLESEFQGLVEEIVAGEDEADEV
jgi:mannose-1-phosphate guanylyltransferase/phosphomannomutase